VATLRGAFLNDPAGFAAIKKIVDDAAPDVIIIDPLVEFFSGDENKAIEMRALLDRLNLLIENTNRSIILTHHLRKPSRDGGGSDFNALRGSSVLFGRIDTGILILPELDGQIKVDFICRNAGKPEKIIASFDENLVIKYIKQAGAKKVHDAMILDLLKEGGKVRIKEVAAKVAAAADCRETTAKEHIRTLIEAGRIKKEGMTKNATIELVD
jgi:hypothetical protein